MDSYVEFNKLRSTKAIPYGTARQFVHPDGLLLPPKKIAGNEYDYGNTFYNSILNSDTGTPGIWISFLPENNVKWFNNVNPYQHYLEAIATVIGRYVRFTQF